MMSDAKDQHFRHSALWDFLGKAQGQYLSDNASLNYEVMDTMSARDIVLYRVDEMTYEEDAPRKEALENVISAVKLQGVTFLYLIVGTPKGVTFYYGLAKDPVSFDPALRLSIPELGKILQSSLLGNFRGCRISDVEPCEKEDLLKHLRDMTEASRIEGVPGAIKDNEEFQSPDRLVDVMHQTDYCLLITAQAVSLEESLRIEASLQAAYSELSSCVKYTEQLGTNVSDSSSKSQGAGTSHSESHSESTTKGTSTSHADGSSESKSHGQGSGSESKSDQAGTSKTETKGSSSSQQDGTSKSDGTSTTESTQTSHSDGRSETLSREFLAKDVQEWLDYCDRVLFPRLDYSRGKGLFRYAFYVLTRSQTDRMTLENTAISLYSGKQGNRMPLKSFPVQSGTELRRCIDECRLPHAQFKTPLPLADVQGRCLLSQDCLDRQFCACNWISTNELAMIAGLPQKEVVGMRLRESVDFGLNYRSPEKADAIAMGHLIKNGNELRTCKVSLNKKVLDKHIFVTGVTGSGKTTSCQRILLQSHLPFLVIEPAKTEYRILANQPECKDLLVFTLGNDREAPFRINPFELMPDESISAHVDMMRASMEASFDMDAAIPQLIERSLYACYERKGWDITTSRNDHYENPFAPGCCSFPLLSDLLDIIPEVVESQGFTERLRDEYVGSIRARLQSLTLGDKGLMLNTPRSIDFDALLDKRVVLELENIRNGGEKSLIMGFVLAAFNEAVKERFRREGQPHQHILLIEEAHRLLSRVMPGDSPNKKLGVETFSDMLAEIRKYGESLVVADQIPNKLAPDVLKNTSTKIVHRLFAQDDKEVVGNTIALNDEQKRYLSNLAIGECVMFSDDFGQAVLVKIEEQTDTSAQPLPVDSLRDRVYDYYVSNGSFIPLEVNPLDLKGDLREAALEFMRMDLPVQMVRQWCAGKRKVNRGYYDICKRLREQKLVTVERMAEWTARRTLQNVGADKLAGAISVLRQFYDGYEPGQERELRRVELSDFYPIR